MTIDEAKELLGLPKEVAMTTIEGHRVVGTPQAIKFIIDIHAQLRALR